MSMDEFGFFEKKYKELLRECVSQNLKNEGANKIFKELMGGDDLLMKSDTIKKILSNELLIQFQRDVSMAASIR